MDPADMVIPVMAVEKEYSMELPDSFLESCRTVGGLFDYLTRQGTGRPI